tara:strand:+ start:620 stop:811 length:192 start_codon:yes stop_codon:yes gene_type:complete
MYKWNVSDRKINVMLKSLQVFEKYGYKYPSVISQQDINEGDEIRRELTLIQSERSNEEKQKQT